MSDTDTSPLSREAGEPVIQLMDASARHIPPHEYVEVRSTAGLLDPDSLEERLRRAEHHAGLLEIGHPGWQSHCWLCRRASEETP